MTSIAAFPSVPDVPAGGDSIIDGVGVAAGGTVSSTRAAGTLGAESAAEAKAAGGAREPESFESNLNRVMESLRAGVDKAGETGREEEPAPSPFSLSADKEGMADPRGGIRSVPGVRTEDIPTPEIIRNRIEVGLNHAASRNTRPRGAQPASHPERIPKKQMDAEEKSGLTGAGGSSGTEVTPAASALLMMPNEPGRTGRPVSRTQEPVDASVDAQWDRLSSAPRLHEKNVLPASAEPNLSKGVVARNVTETLQDGSNPIAGHDQAFSDQRMMKPERKVVETAEGETLIHAAQDSLSTSAARESARVAAPESTESIETQNPSLHLSTRQAELKGVPVQDVNGRPARHAIRADAAGDIEREKAFAGPAAQQGMDQGRMREAASAIGQVEQRAYNLTEAVRPSTSASNGPAGSDPFSVLDADQAAGPMSWIHAGAHRAEAGYLDPALGWVSVRAEAVSGGIHAAVVPGSPEAAQVLGGHMTGLSSHLAQQHGDTTTVTLASAQDGRDGLGWGSQAGGGDRGTERHSAGGNETRQTVLTDVPARHVHTGSGATTIDVLVPGRSGSTISVMA